MAGCAGVSVLRGYGMHCILKEEIKWQMKK
jgi:hypothetical protein